MNRRNDGIEKQQANWSKEQHYKLNTTGRHGSGKYEQK
jgi:hypothetical protein